MRCRKSPETWRHFAILGPHAHPCLDQKVDKPNLDATPAQKLRHTLISKLLNVDVSHRIELRVFLEVFKRLTPIFKKTISNWSLNDIPHTVDQTTSIHRITVGCSVEYKHLFTVIFFVFSKIWFISKFSAKRDTLNSSPRSRLASPARLALFEPPLGRVYFSKFWQTWSRVSFCFPKIRLNFC